MPTREPLSEMNRSIRRASFLFVALTLAVDGVSAEISDDRLRAAAAGGDPSFIVDIRALAPPEQKELIQHIGDLAQASVAAQSDVSETSRLVQLLALIGDDSAVVAVVKPLLDSSSPVMQDAAFEALSARHGTEVGTVLAGKIRSYYEMLPELPTPTMDTATSRAMNLRAAMFLRCLIGLLRSDVPEYRKAGETYYTLLEQKYSTSKAGQDALVGFKMDLRYANVTLPDHSVPAGTMRPTAAAAHTPSPTSTRSGERMRADPNSLPGKSAPPGKGSSATADSSSSARWPQMAARWPQMAIAAAAALLGAAAWLIYFRVRRKRRQ